MKLLDEDLRNVLSRIPKDVRSISKERGLLIGGGFIRSTIAGEKPNDIDMFGASKDVLELSAKDLHASRNTSKLHKTDNAFTVFCPPRLPVQFIHRWLYHNTEEGAHKLLCEFDFTIAQAVIWYENVAWTSMISERFYCDLASKRLNYTSPRRTEDAGGSILRVRKFLARGYNIQVRSLGAIIARVGMAVRWNEIFDKHSDPYDREDAVANVIAGLLREVDPLAVVDGIDPINNHESEI